MPADEATDTDRTEVDAKVAPDLGEKLRAAREARGLTIDDVSAELRIEKSSLVALEECRLEALGVPVFAKGYIKHYAALLELDAGELLEEYDRLGGQKAVEVEPSRTIKLRDDRQIAVWVVAAIVLAGVIAYLVYWWLGQSA